VQPGHYNTLYFDRAVVPQVAAVLTRAVAAVKKMQEKQNVPELKFLVKCNFKTV
jgi:hypothetical protein